MPIQRSAASTNRALARYSARREFTRTPEPGPTPVSGRQGPLLFVVQKHAARRLHYDLRLELDGVLKSWAVPKGPSLDPGDKRLAVEVEDHPFEYASFEGHIPDRQYGAGNVIVWDCGVYSPDEEQQYSFGDREEAEARVRRELSNGKLSFLLRGEKLKGSFALVRTSTAKQWLLIKHKDRFAQQNDVLAQAQSVLSGRAVDDRAPAKPEPRVDALRLAPAGTAEAMPKSISPMLAESSAAARSDPNWSHEPKVDGYRVLAFVHDGNVRLQSRRGLDLTPAFPEVTAALADQAVDRMILDGELVALDGAGRPSFNALQNRAGLKQEKQIAEAQRQASVVLLCFDLLHFGGLNLRGNPYVDRRRYLSQCLLTSGHVQLVHASDDAEQLYAASMASGFEGIVSKRKDSIYLPGKRSKAWLKIKAKQSSEFVVGGYTLGKGARDSLGSLLLGYWEGDELQYVGHVGSGLDGKWLDDVRARLESLATRQCPFTPKPPLHRPTRWVKPELVAEVNFAAWTPGGHLRAPVFLRLRDDVTPRSIVSGPDERTPPPDAADGSTADQVAEAMGQLDGKSSRAELRIGDARIAVTNLDREYWPANPRARQAAVTKRDLLRYLIGVSPYMLPHLAHRPLTMIRMPAGINGQRFFQKHWTQARPEFVETITVYSGHKDEQHEYLLANNLPSLIWLGQVGTLEFHVWHSRAELGPDTAIDNTDYSSSRQALEGSVLNYPDYLVFDIDPYIYSGKEAKGAEPELNRKGFSTGRRVAFWLRDLLRDMSLEAVVKTSGKTGLHVFVPIERTVTFDQARALCEMVGRHLMQEHPREITMEWSVEKRTGKIFYDYNMNVRGKTLNVAYSPRGVAGAPVSMPLTWEELEAAEPADFTLHNALRRLEKTGDRWQHVLSAKQSLLQAFDISRGKES